MSWPSQRMQCTLIWFEQKIHHIVCTLYHKCVLLEKSQDAIIEIFSCSAVFSLFWCGLRRFFLSCLSGNKCPQPLATLLCFSWWSLFGVRKAKGAFPSTDWSDKERSTGEREWLGDWKGENQDVTLPMKWTLNKILMQQNRYWSLLWILCWFLLWRIYI